MSPNSEVERRGASLASSEESLSRPSIPSLAYRRRDPRSLQPIVRRYPSKLRPVPTKAAIVWHFSSTTDLAPCGAASAILLQPSFPRKRQPGARDHWPPSSDPVISRNPFVKRSGPDSINEV